MKITLFGATGNAGTLLTRKALEAGHDVTVYARNPQKLAIRHDRLHLVQGELNNVVKMDEAIAGRDAVISVLGPRPGAKGAQITDGTKEIIAAMKAHGVRRLIATSTPSFRDPQDRFQFSFWLGTNLVKVLQRSAFDDVVGAASAVHDSGLEWTLVRIPMLSDKESTPPPNAGYVGDGKIRLLWLSRSVLASFLLEQLNNKDWVQRSPVISNRS